MLADYNNIPYDLEASKVTSAEVYEKWPTEKYPTVSKSNVSGYVAAFGLCSSLNSNIFKDLKLIDLQHVVDTCGIKNDICNKNYSEFVDIVRYKDRTPNKYDCNKFNKKIDRIWEQKEDKYYQIVLMLIYNGLRVSELLDLKKENVHLDEQYFDVISSKTENGIRKVPIVDKVLPFYQSWFDSALDCEYLLHTEDNKHLLCSNYYDSYFSPLMQNLNIEKTPHCCRHTCISLLAEAGVDQTIIKKITGHSGAMSLTEKVYAHFDVQELVKAINLI